MINDHVFLKEQRIKSIINAIYYDINFEKVNSGMFSNQEKKGFRLSLDEHGPLISYLAVRFSFFFKNEENKVWFSGRRQEHVDKASKGWVWFMWLISQKNTLERLIKRDIICLLSEL